MCLGLIFWLLYRFGQVVFTLFVALLLGTILRPVVVALQRRGLPVAERLPAPSALFGALTGEEGQLVLPTLLGFTQNNISVVSAALVILFLSIYWSIDQVHFERLWLSLWSG